MVWAGLCWGCRSGIAAPLVAYGACVVDKADVGGVPEVVVGTVVAEVYPPNQKKTVTQLPGKTR